MEIVVIGGGPAGRSAAMEASALGEEVKLIEKDKVGGKCLHQGCMVVCGLNDIAKFYLDSQNYHSLGITDEVSPIDFSKVTKGVRETATKIKKVLEYETKSTGVEIIKREAHLLKKSVKVGEEEILYDKLIIGTGSRASIPPIKGAENAMTYAEIPYLKKIPEKLLIIGSGVIATEFANIFSSLGSKVKVFCRNYFLPKLDPDIRNYVQKNLLKNVDIMEKTSIEEITTKGLRTTEGTWEGEVLLATGLTPNSEVAKGMVEIGEKNEIIVDPQMKTSNPNIYAAGDVIGGVSNTPISRVEGVTAARNACGISSTVDYSLIPYSISLYYDVSFFSPQNLESGTVGTIPGSAGPGSFWRTLEGMTGLTKVAVDVENGKINGITSISPSSRTNMSYMAKMIRDGYKTHDFDDFIEVHPSTDAVYKMLRFFSKY
ncbi:MAG: NAD(P)/FAD-dependent oxidoreductase [Methanobacteriaceae archaeon]|nr:NAD(P)/FAD-dependent oxidoreductase [Methanobacteriaceae archaeon]